MKTYFKLVIVMKISRLNMKWFCRSLILVSSLLNIYGFINAQTSSWNGTSWSNGTPSGSTGSYTFNVDGSGCTIGDASIGTLNINPNGICTITGTVNATNVNLPLDAVSSLDVEGTLNVINLYNVSFLKGTGTVNLSAGTYSQTDGTNFGSCNVFNFNILTGNVTFSTYFNFHNMTIAQGANVIISYTNNPAYPVIVGTLTVNGSLVNKYQYKNTSKRPYTYSYFSIGNLLINSSGSFNSTNGYSRIDQTFKVGGSIAAAGSVYSYSYNFNLSSSTNVLEIFGNADLKLSDLTYTDPLYQYLGSLKVYGGGKLTVNKNLTVTSYSN